MTFNKRTIKYGTIKTVETRSSLIVPYFVVFFSRFYTQPDDGYIGLADICNCF